MINEYYLNLLQLITGGAFASGLGGNRLQGAFYVSNFLCECFATVSISYNYYIKLVYI